MMFAPTPEMLSNWEDIAKALSATCPNATVLFTQLQEGKEVVLLACSASIEGNIKRGTVLPFSYNQFDVWTDRKGHTAFFDEATTIALGFHALFSIPVSINNSQFGFIKLVGKQAIDFQQAVLLLPSIRNTVELELKMADRLKRAEAVVEHEVESWGHLPTIFNAAPVAMLLIDQQFKTVAINNIFTKLFGVEKAQVLNKQPGDGLGCIIALNHPKGCGQSLACSSCVLRNSIKKVLYTRQPIHNVESNLCLMVEGGGKKNLD